MARARAAQVRTELSLVPSLWLRPLPRGPLPVARVLAVRRARRPSDSGPVARCRPPCLYQPPVGSLLRPRPPHEGLTRARPQRAGRQSCLLRPRALFCRRCHHCIAISLFAARHCSDRNAGLAASAQEPRCRALPEAVPPSLPGYFHQPLRLFRLEADKQQA